MSEDRPRILIVDDREQNRYVLSRILRQAGYGCIELGTGAEALAHARTLPSLIILDVRLPDMSGYEVTRRVKQDPGTAHVPVLQISASMVSSESKAKALEAGADGYLVHPIDATVLVATVRALLRLHAAEAIARRSAEQWQSTFDALSEGVAFINSEGRLVRWNAAFAEICGFSFRFQAGDDASQLMQTLLGTSEPLRLDGPESYRTEFSINERAVQISINRVSAETADSGLVLVLSDITDRQLAEYALRTAEKISATGKLAHAIAHEINNPLEALTNLIYLAQASPSVEIIQGFLAHANEELARIARITRQTLAFHRDSQDPVALDIGRVVSEVVTLYQRSASARHVQIVCDNRPTPGVYGFHGQLSQVFGNLIRNAAEAAPPGSRVAVRVRPISRAGEPGTRVSIHDCGPGIPWHVRKKLFDPFFTTKELKGSGLGLWVSRNLVMKHRGTIRFRTSTRTGSSGTTFEVYLPAGVEPLKTLAEA